MLDAPITNTSHAELLTRVIKPFQRRSLCVTGNEEQTIRKGRAVARALSGLILISAATTMHARDMHNPPLAIRLIRELFNYYGNCRLMSM
jgi:hypothetical protein